MKKKNISVIIPAYNVANSLQQCLDSVIKQTCQPKEIIVINDGSTDNTSEIAKFYKDSILYIEQSNKGQGSARNEGLKRAKGEYIAFLDADDYWLPDFLKTCSIFLDSNKNTVAVWTAWIKQLDEKKSIIVPPIMNSKSEEKISTMIIDNFFEFWAEQDHLQTGSILIRNEIIKKAGLQRADLRNSQDLEYWALIATYGKWGFIAEPHYVNNSRMAAKGNWITKYKKRRSLCPDVETWEERLLPRLTNKDIPGFNVIRGRVAAGYAHNKILSGNYKGALHIVKEYGPTMPKNRLTKLFVIGSNLGKIVWVLVCYIIKIKEYYKAWRM